MSEISTISSRHCAVPALLRSQAQYASCEAFRAKLADVQNIMSGDGQISAPNVMKSLNHEPGIDADMRRS